MSSKMKMKITDWLVPLSRVPKKKQQVKILLPHYPRHHRHLLLLCEQDAENNSWGCNNANATTQTIILRKTR